MIGVINIKVAIISDIHGNIEALEAVLNDIKNDNVDKVVALGDLCNELPNGNEVINVLRDINAYGVKGNKEEYFLDYEKHKYEWENIQFKNTIFMYNQLTEENKEYIRKLPFELVLDIEGTKVKFVHASPESLCELVYEKDDERLEEIAKTLEEDILIYGHIHDPIWIKEVKGKTFINTGCAGVSVFNIGQAEYVILDIKDGKINIETRKANFDLEKVKENIIKSKMHLNERTFINLVYLALTGERQIRKKFYREGAEKMLNSGRKLYKENVEGIYKNFKLLDDDIWIEQSKEIEDLFLI